MSGHLRIVYGDIHNHNAHGYGIGSIERSTDIARTHLDFFAFTGHSSWHDLGRLENGWETHFNEGFARLAETWPHVQSVIADSNRDQDFCSFLGFEWHSNFYGDQCVVFPNDHQPIHYADTLKELREFCLAKSALMIPHHLAYPSGHRGVNWSEFEERCSPVVEIYSWHGSSEDDRGPFPMFKGSPGGRETGNTVAAALAEGRRFGFVASSDNHAGFPGAYGEGLMAALVEDLTRPAILAAIRDRRTYALTGDRIELDFTVNGALMGSDIEAGDAVDVEYRVKGRDEIEVVEVIQGRHRCPPIARDRKGHSRDGIHRPFPGAPRMGVGTLEFPGPAADRRLGLRFGTEPRPHPTFLPLPLVGPLRREPPSPIPARWRTQTIRSLLQFAQTGLSGKPQSSPGSRNRGRTGNALYPSYEETSGGDDTRRGARPVLRFPPLPCWSLSRGRLSLAQTPAGGHHQRRG